MASASLSGGVLTIFGTGDADAISVTTSGSSLFVSGPSGTSAFPVSAVSRVVVQAGAGDDRVDLSGVWCPSTAYGSAGRDTLHGGYGPDQMHGGAGTDALYGNWGDDTAYGDGGDDTVAGGDGNDWLHGGDGADAVIGGNGTDTQYGGYGNDSLVSIDGGTGDYADGQDGADSVWQDSNVVWNGWGPSFYYDTGYAEKVHNVQSFADGADRTLDGDAIADPTDGANYKSFRDRPLFAVGGPSVDAVDQEAAADCWPRSAHSPWTTRTRSGTWWPTSATGLTG